MGKLVKKHPSNFICDMEHAVDDYDDAVDDYDDADDNNDYSGDDDWGGGDNSAFICCLTVFADVFTGGKRRQNL